MSYQVISTRPAARGKVYYNVLISEGQIIILKLDPNASQEAIDSNIEEYLFAINQENSNTTE